MSFRPHPLRHSQTVDYSVSRQPSDASSSASSGYSGSSGLADPGRASTHSSTPSSPTSIYSLRGHKRGQSEASRLPPILSSAGSLGPKQTPDNIYSAARQSLRPLAQAPASSTAPAPAKPAVRHDRGQSLDLGKLSLRDGGRSSPASPPRPMTARPYSMLLSRSDSVTTRGSSAVAHAHSPSAHHIHAAPLATPDLEKLGRSTTNQLRTLSRLAQSGSGDEFKLPAQEVVGLRGRRRLQRSDRPGGAQGGQRSGGYGWEGRNWMDKQRQFLQAYEYLCHIGEAKEWIEDIIQASIPAIVELEEALRNGVTLAEVVEALNPDRRYRIFRHVKLQFRHSDNIAIFFRYLDEVGLPDLFRFELIDLYEKKNIPKVIYCIHALSWLLFRKGIVDFHIGNLVGQLEFAHHELEAMQKGLDKLGASMPSFGTMEADFGVQPEPEPEETEEERTDRELAENEASITDLQAQIRAALVRIRLGGIMQKLWDAEHSLVQLQALVRGDFTRQVMSYRLQMRRFAVDLQSAARGFLARRRMARRERLCRSSEGGVLALQSLIRATKARREVQGRRSQLATAAGPVREAQAFFRGFLARQRVLDQRHETSRASDTAPGLQGAIRGTLLRGRLQRQRDALQGEALAITRLQARARAVLARKQVGLRLHGLQDHAPAWQALQACARAMLARKRIGLRRQGLEEHASTWQALQACARAMLARKRTGLQLQSLGGHASTWQALQARARAMLARERIALQRQELQGHASTWQALQASARAMLARKRIALQLQSLEDHASAWQALQARARAMLARERIALQRQELQGHASTWQTLQAACRGMMARASTRGLEAELREHTRNLDALQGCIRGAAVRRDISDSLEELGESEDEVLELQSLVRGMLLRQRVAGDGEALAEQGPRVTALQSRARGLLHRRRHAEVLGRLRSHEQEAVSLQALARAMVLRSDVSVLLEHLDEQEGSVAALQTATKAFIVRARFNEKKRFFRENMQRVVKIQSFVRAKLQGEAYKNLTTGKNPPVGAVKNFVHLLNDSDFDFNEEVEFERLRKTVVQQVRQNEMLEQYIDQLDIKIALLVKNKITLDEVIRHQSNFGGHTSSLLANSAVASANHFDLKALNKSSRKKLESYQQLFFALQTHPQYLARLFKHIREQGTAEKECKRVEHLMMGLFGYAQKRREEYYLLKLIGRSVREEAESCAGLQDYVRGSFFWCRLLGSYTRSPRDRKYLRDLLGNLIRDNIVEDPDLDLESDPLQIYKAIINNEELSNGLPSKRPLNIPREVAIKDRETQELFVDHLRDLREICDQFLMTFEDVLGRMPYGLRFVCREIFEALRQRFEREPRQALLHVVFGWLWRFYLQPALTSPENVGAVDKQLSPLQKRNLGAVAKVLGQIAHGRLFGGEDLYLQPLNKFVGESIERLGHIAGRLIAVPDVESTFDIDEFNDLYAKNKPTLYIKMTDIFAIHSLVAAALPQMCPGRDDVLREIIQDLGSAKHNESEMTAAGSSDIQMFLTPKLHDVEDPEAEVKALFMETKRCILYIIRVQSGGNLLEILIKQITPEDERKWQALLREDFADGSSARGAYSDANMTGVAGMTYYDLKRTALENILRLEHMGRISKQNHYQDVLNAIALDIRTKSRRRIQRQRELEGVRLTLANLHQKASYLEQQRKSYDDYIEQAMATLQNKKGKKRFLLPFTKQYNHQRELERSGRVPKFGSYKYSARTLAERGVLVSWAGVPERDWDRVNITISCDQVGVFAIEGSRGHIQIPGASALVSIEDLLQAQFESHQFKHLFEANLKLNVNLLLHTLYKKFYRTQ